MLWHCKNPNQRISGSVNAHLMPGIHLTFEYTFIVHAYSRGQYTPWVQNF